MAPYIIKGLNKSALLTYATSVLSPDIESYSKLSRDL